VINEMACVSIKQPWADAILFLGKPVENRTWPTRHRGPIAIHASSTWDDYGEAWLKMKIRPTTPAIDAFLAKARGRTGCVVGSVEIVDCLRPDEYETMIRGECLWAEGPWCWVLKCPEAWATTVPMKGKLGIFEAHIETDGRTL
jgi:hypothetical protein